MPKQLNWKIILFEAEGGYEERFLTSQLPKSDFVSWLASVAKQMAQP